PPPPAPPPPAPTAPPPAPAVTEPLATPPVPLAPPSPGAAPVVVPPAAPPAPKPVGDVLAPPQPPLALPPAAPAIAEIKIVVPPVLPAVPAAPPPPPEPPPPPPPPPPPRIGDKVGFIQLPQKPAPRTTDRGGPARQPPRPAAPTSRFTRPAQRPGAPHLQPARPPVKVTDKAEPAKAPAKPTRPAEPQFVPPPTAGVISIKPPIVVRDLAEQLKRKPFQLIADLMELGVFANVNQAIDETIAVRLCGKYGFRFEVEKRERGAGVIHAPVKKVDRDPEDKVEDLISRAPVVTIMGHVDHGKTTLLDIIRKTNVAAGEAGGITQHIGAYTISIPHPERKHQQQQITFLDTPGHAAFSSMRARGANVTDVVVLVVAANDGVMPQTIEALNHARAAKVPIVVAVNKTDHPNANALKVRQQLQDKGLIPDVWGGDTMFIDVSGLTGQGVDKLLEAILLQADLLELKANPKRRAKGNVIESGLEPGGPTATVLVRKGTLRVGETILCGVHYGRVRALISEEGERLKEAGPSVAVRVLGLNGVPEAGLEFSVVENEKAAREMTDDRVEQVRLAGSEKRAKITLENLFEALAQDTAKVLKVVVKADTQGSVEAIVDALKKVDSTKVALEVLHNAVGTITESDVLLASASKAIVIGFHTRVDGDVSDVAKREGVQIKLYTIIYELIDQVKEAMAGLLEPLTREVVIGVAEVRKVFELSKGPKVAGCVITNGRVVRGRVRLNRRKSTIYEGVTQSIKRFQDEVGEVRAGMECGIRLENFDDFQVGDTIESYTVEKVAQKL
ncbi:MAG: translation initiation factor IF-2, partial [Verrucomicrobia bacterium]|nr:translation initiation factor IF-2 [Verrucomicrobiota bacterium]